MRVRGERQTERQTERDRERQREREAERERVDEVQCELCVCVRAFSQITAEQQQIGAY